MLKSSLLIIGLVSLVHSAVADSSSKKLDIYTVATEYTDGLHRLLRSAKLFGANVNVLGLGREWRGGNVATSAGGAQKLNVIAEHLKALCEDKSKEDDIWLFTDAYDSILVSPPSDIITSFEKMDANIVVAAESFLWPDRSLASEYPAVSPNEYPFLCSGGYMGYTKAICELLLPRTPLADDDDDQLFFTKIFLDKELREKMKIKLDTTAEIFQSLHGSLNDIQIKHMGSHTYAYNSKTETNPKILHGNGPIKSEFNRLTDYIPDGWSTQGGCHHCHEETFSLKDKPESEWPIVTLAFFIEMPTPFLLHSLAGLKSLKYPRERMNVFIHNAIEFHNRNVSFYLEQFEKEPFLGVTYVGPEKDVSDQEARNLAIDECEKVKCDRAFFVESFSRFTNPDTLKILIEQNRSTIAPLLKRPDELWSNFWGAVSSNGYYKRSDDYMEIVKNEKQGLWNAPFISSAIMFSSDRLKKLRNAWKHDTFDPDIALANFMREKGMFMYALNTKLFGHLINYDDFIIENRVHPELWEIAKNRVDWEEDYITSERWEVGAKDDEGKAEHQSKYELCPDVYSFPLVTVKFCDDLVDEMEHYGEWSGGKNEDSRLAGGYENVPTVDIHMRQISFQEEWLHLLKTYVAPLASFAYTGYHPDSKAIMNFVVRYHPKEQDHLRPHFDSSTFSTNIALRRIGVDFEGGGTRFVRYNCSITSQKQGWILMHPGRLTHWHEGLRVTKGVRYIAVSFVDP